MVITSYGFLLLFLPLFFLFYWRTRHKLLVLFIASYLFYALGGLLFVPLLLGLSLATYALAHRQRTGIGIALNLLALAFFKYWNFGVDTANSFTSSLGLGHFFPLISLALPLGISFYVFKHIGYLLDIRARRYPPITNSLLFITYSAFFPQISAGPMSVSNDTLRQLANIPSRLDSNQLYQGLTFISVGLVKKILIADPLSSALATGLFTAGESGSGLIWAWSSVVVYALQLYFDFSAYTDIALGIGSLFGITLPPNFNNPYLATSPADFWTRWHISLSTWFRFYLFFPFSRSLLKRWGANRSELAQYTSNIVTMSLIGLWHGAGWGFVLWGLYHGLLLNAYAWAKRRRVPLEGHFLLVITVLIGWALFLSPDLPFAANLLSNMFGLAGIGSFAALLSLYSPAALLIAVVALFLTIVGRIESANLPSLRHPAYAAALGVLAVLCLIHLGAAVQFIYIQF
jgi:alginate O-acetyltransferase complex protein AlgI